MAKLHELLAVEADVKSQFRTILMETNKVFKADHLFKGFTRTLKMFDEKDADMEGTERLELTTTVPERLKYTNKFISRFLDVTYQKECTNQIAVADIIVDGQTGLLVPPQDPSALAEALIQLLKSPEKRRELGNAGRRRLFEHYTHVTMAEKFVSVYRRMLEEKQNGQ